MFTAKKSLLEIEVDRCWWWQRESLLKLITEERNQKESRALQERILTVQERKHEENLAFAKQRLELQFPKVFTTEWWDHTKAATPAIIGTAVLAQAAGAPFWGRFALTYFAAVTPARSVFGPV
jgi:hypothetical protein